MKLYFPENSDFENVYGVLESYLGNGGDVVIPDGVTTAKVLTSSEGPVTFPATDDKEWVQLYTVNGRKEVFGVLICSKKVIT